MLNATDVRRHAGHERGQQAGQRDARACRWAGTCSSAAGSRCCTCRSASSPPRSGIDHQRDQARDDRRRRDEDLREGADQRRALGGATGSWPTARAAPRRSSSSSSRRTSTKPRPNTMPIQSRRAGWSTWPIAGALPGVQRRPRRAWSSSTLSFRPPQPPTSCRPTIVSGISAGEDHEELQHLVVDRRGQAAERDVGEHDDRGDDDAEPRSASRAALAARARARRGSRRRSARREREGQRVEQVRAAC